MPSYAAFLGNQPRLSLAEIAALLPDFSLRALMGKQVALFSTSKPIDPKTFAHWGGTVVLAEEIAGVTELDDVPKALTDATKGIKGKVTFAIRTFGVSKDSVHDLYRTCKKELKKKGVSSRYVGNERAPAATALLRDTGLLDGKGGAEIVVVKEEKTTWIGRTVAAQDPDAYTKRDMDKPVRDTRTGLLPPKLAQILLNLGASLVPMEKGKPKAALTVLDPFCGTGVIPIECLVRGWHVLASDKSEKAIAGCTKNLEWIRKEDKIKKTDVKSVVWKQDALKPFALKEKPDLIVSETTLGPPLSDRPTVKDAQKMRSEAERLEIDFLKNAAASLPGVPLSLTWPVWYLRMGTLRMEKPWEALAEIGYEAVLPKGVEGDTPERPSIVYRRGDQLVGREIVLLRPLSKS